MMFIGPLVVALGAAFASLVLLGSSDVRVVEPRRDTVATRMGSPALRVGRWLLRFVRADADDLTSRHLGRGAFVVGLAMLVSPVLAVLVAMSVGIFIVGARRRRTRAAAHKLHAGMADVIDLFAMVLTSGGTIVASLETARSWAPDPYGAAFDWCTRQIQVGRPVSDVLEDLSDRVDVAIRPLAAALIAHTRYGAPIIDNLTRLAHDARLAHRRRAETAARRLPVVMLFPLVVCILPAFILLTVVPVVADTFAGFGLSAGP